MSSHKFKIGQSVNYTSGPFGAGSASSIRSRSFCRPKTTIFSIRLDFQYKIKSAAEPREGGQGASLTTPDDAGTLIQGHDYDV